MARKQKLVHSSWTGYGTGSRMTRSRYRKKWSWYFINIAPRWEALKVDRATMSNRWSRCLKPITVKTVPVMVKRGRTNDHSQFLLSSLGKKESNGDSVYPPRLKRAPNLWWTERTVFHPNFISFKIRLNTSQINIDVKCSQNDKVFETISNKRTCNSEIKMYRSIQFQKIKLFIFETSRNTIYSNSEN